MERLTRKSLEYKDTWIADGFLSNIDGVVRGKAIDKLAEFENFMERNDLQELEQLQEIIERDKFNHLITTPFEQENQALKSRWQKLKEWVKRKYTNDSAESNDINSPFEARDYYGASAGCCELILNKMQELEKEIK